MIIFDGKKEAAKLDLKFRKLVSNLPQAKTLLIVQIGDNPSSEKYIKLKLKYCEKIGLPVIFRKIDPSLEDRAIFNEVENLFLDENIDGGIIQLPLPRESLKKVLNLIPYNKDLDLLSDTKRQSFYSKNFEILPPVVQALNHFLYVAKITLLDLHVTVLGGGDLVGKPISFYLASKGAKVTLLDENNLYKRGRKLQADLVVTAMGEPYILDPNDLDYGTNFVDFGSAVVENKTVGDLDTDISYERLGFVSLSPGGMGPLVVRYLIGNMLVL